MRTRWVVAALLAVGGVAWQSGWGRERSPSGRVQGTVLNAVRVQGNNSPLAGISARGGVEVRALSLRRIGANTASPDYHRYMNRCMACHAAPAPDLHTAAEWPGVIARMHGNMRSAGTLGLNEADRSAVLRFLARHAKQ